MTYPTGPVSVSEIPNIPPQTVVMVENSGGLSQVTLAGLILTVLGWIIWGYLWVVFAAVSIQFVRSGFDIASTIGEFFDIVLYPIYWVLAKFWEFIYIYILCPLQDVPVIKLLIPDLNLCKGDKSDYCDLDNPFRSTFSFAHVVCGKNKNCAVQLNDLPCPSVEQMKWVCKDTPASDEYKKEHKECDTHWYYTPGYNKSKTAACDSKYSAQIGGTICGWENDPKVKNVPTCKRSSMPGCNWYLPIKQ